MTWKSLTEALGTYLPPSFTTRKLMDTAKKNRSQRGYSTKRYRSASDLRIGALVTIGTDGVVTYANPNEATGKVVSTSTKIASPLGSSKSIVQYYASVEPLEKPTDITQILPDPIEDNDEEEEEGREETSFFGTESEGIYHRPSWLCDTSRPSWYDTERGKGFEES